MNKRFVTKQDEELILYRNAFYKMSLSLAVSLWECFPAKTIERKVIGLRYGLYGTPSLSISETVDNLKRLSHLSLSEQAVKDFELLSLKIMLHQII